MRPGIELRESDETLETQTRKDESGKRTVNHRNHVSNGQTHENGAVNRQESSSTEDDRATNEAVRNANGVGKRRDQRTVGVIGLGFAGLTLGAVLGDVGYSVFGAEVDEARLRLLQTGKPHLHEKGLVAILRKCFSAGTFSVGSRLDRACDVYIVAVGTPIGDDGNPDLTYIRAAAHGVGPLINRGNLVLIRSTVPVGTTRSLIKPILESESGLRCGEDFALAFAPERTVEGNAIEELRTLPQVIGGYDRRSVEMARFFFEPVTKNIAAAKSLEAAEMIKLVNNSFRDLSFAFANELAAICDLWNLDAFDVVRSANAGYPRNPIPLPSPGVGGPCLTKDPILFAAAGKERGYMPRLPHAGRAVNDIAVERIGEKVLRFCRRNAVEAVGAKAFIVGFAFKGHPETSDLRNSPTLDLLPILREAGFELFGYDPVVPDEDLETCGITPVGLTEGFSSARLVLVMNNHKSYTGLALCELLPRMEAPAMFFDGWDLFDRRQIEDVKGVEYAGISGSF